MFSNSVATSRPNVHVLFSLSKKEQFLKKVTLNVTLDPRHGTFDPRQKDKVDLNTILDMTSACHEI